MTTFEFFRNRYEEKMSDPMNQARIRLINNISDFEIGTLDWLYDLDMNLCFTAVTYDEISVLGMAQINASIADKTIKVVRHQDGRSKSAGLEYIYSLTAKGFRKLYRAYPEW